MDTYLDFQTRGGGASLDHCLPQHRQGTNYTITNFTLRSNLLPPKIIVFTNRSLADLKSLSWLVHVNATVLAAAWTGHTRPALVHLRNHPRNVTGVVWNWH